MVAGLAAQNGGMGPLWMDSDLAAECHQIQAPTLVVTGEPHLDRVVPVASSLD